MLDRRTGVILWLLPVVCVVVTPGLVWMVAERPMAARLELGIGATVAVAAFALGLLAILSRGFKQRIRWALSVTAVTTLAFFQWPTLTFVGGIIKQLAKVSLLADATPVVVAVGLIWLATRRGDEWLFPTIVFAGTLPVVLVLVSALLSIAVSAPPAARGQAEPDAPDVVLLILDGYTRADILSDQFGMDNTAFLADLERLGFVVATEARANYSFTYASLATMYEQDYAYDIGPTTPSEEAAMRSALSGSPAMFNRFREAGYEIAFVENAWQGSHCGAAVDICIRDGFIQRVLWVTGQITIFAPIQQNLQIHPFNQISFDGLDALPSYLLDGRTDEVPRLTVAHIILPHPPFLRDAECNFVTSTTRRAFLNASEELIANRRQYYADQAMCTNQKVVTALGEILAERPDTLVMITADHGSGSTRMANAPSGDWSDDAIRERMSILSAYRVPGCDSQLYPDITPVNGSRIITNCAIGTNLDLLPDLNLWAPATGRGTVVDVSERLYD